VNEEPQDYFWSAFPDVFTQKANGSFCQRADAMQFNRKKSTHTQGVVAQVEWKAVPNNYSGIYSTGSTEVLIRLSQTTNLTADCKGLFPSLALKFLRDGDESENLFAMPNFTGTESWDFFEHTMRNRVEPFHKETHATEIATI